MLFSICEKAFGRIGKKLEKNKLPKGGKDSGVECDTKTPGCEHLCIDSFFPVSPVRFNLFPVEFRKTVFVPLHIFLILANKVGSDGH